MNILKRRIRIELESGQWSYWMPAEEFKRYRAGSAKSVVIEETMSYADAMKYLNPKAISKGLDDAISDELKNGPKSIMGS